MHKNLKEFIIVFNNLCRKDRNVDRWAVYIDEFIDLQIDIVFIDYNDELCDCHKKISLNVINILNYIEIENFAKDVYNNLKRNYEIGGNK